MVDATCTAKAAQQKRLPISGARMMGLEVAARMLGGTDNLAGILDIKGPAPRVAFTSARRIINGIDKAEMIAGYAMSFQAALVAGGWA